jgi:hypothetical protein
MFSQFKCQYWPKMVVWDLSYYWTYVLKFYAVFILMWFVAEPDDVLTDIKPKHVAANLWNGSKLFNK